MVDLLKEEYNVDVEWRPFYLRPDTPPEGMDLPDYILRAKASGADERLRSMAQMHGMEFASPDRIYNTRIAHEATEHARRLGKANEFHKIVFRKVYAEAKDISKWEHLLEAAQEVGLHPEEMRVAVESGAYTEEVAAQVYQAQRMGVTGVPTYVIDNRYAVVGAQPYEAFKNALAQILTEKKAAK